MTEHEEQTSRAANVAKDDLPLRRSTRGNTVQMLLEWRPLIGGPVDLYSFLAAFGILGHLYRGGYSTVLENIGGAGAITAAFALMLRPSSRLLLGALAGCVVVDYSFESPFQSNHSLLVALLAALTLACLAVARISKVSGNSGDRLAGTLFPTVGLALVGTFLWAAFHKLNSGFLDSVLSCAVEHQRTAMEAFGLPSITGGRASVILIVAAYILEFGIPVGLLFRRSRWLAVGVGFVFHYFNALNGHHAFSALAISMYVPFVPADTWKSFAGKGASPYARCWGPVVVRLMVGMAALWVIVGSFLAFVGVHALNWRAASIPYLLVGLGVAVVVAFHWRATNSTTIQRDNDAFARDYRPGVILAGVGLVILSANAMTPYLGVRTQNALSMFSNIRTEPGRWNHFVLPESVLRFDTYRNYVSVTHWGPTGSPEDVMHGGALINEFELRRSVSAACRNGPVELTYSAEGKDSDERHLTDACSSPLGRELPLLERKLLYFRPIDDPNACQH